MGKYSKNLFELVTVFYWVAAYYTWFEVARLNHNPKREREMPCATAPNMFPMSLPQQFVDREGEAPAEPLHHWLGRSLALPKRTLPS